MSVEAGQLRSLIERIERLEEDKRVIALRRKSREEREQEEALVETYLQALGM